jgi:small GTP-binding protein
METNTTTAESQQNPPKEEEIKVESLPEDYPQYDLSFKLIFIGDSGVGKSCLTSKAVKNNFEDYYQATVGFEFLTFNMVVNKMVIKLQIWDTCGQEIYKSLISNFYRNSSLAVLVYSIDSKDSFEHVGKWLDELKNQANPDVRIFLVGNKADLEEKREVQKEEGLKYKNDQQLDLFMESSAKTGYNARNVLVEAAKILYKDYLKLREAEENENNPNKNNSRNQKISKQKDGNNKKKKCC